MSSLPVPWLLFPLGLLALSYGCGLLLECAAGRNLPGALVVPCGFAVLTLVAQFAVLTDATAELAMPAVVVAAGVGVVLARPWRSFHVDGWAAGAGVGAFAAYAAPIVLSGEAGFAGYVKLDDDSTLVALVDRAMEHGRDISGLEPSTYLRVVDLLLDEGYPLGSLLPMGIGHEIVRTDTLWLYQPAMAFMAAMLGLGLYALAGRIVEQPWVKALAAFVGSQAALLYGYALWGGIKELGSAWAVPVLAALVPAAVKYTSLRHFIPLAAVTALLFGVLNAGALVWVAPALAVCLVLIIRERGWREALRPTGAFVGFLAILGLPTIVAAPAFLASNIVSFDPIANLGAPLNPIEIAGIWPAGDFRADPSLGTATRIIIVVAVAAAVGAAVWAVRRGLWSLPIYVLGAVASAVALWAFSTPWIEAKGFATAAPAIPFGAVVAAALVAKSGRIVEGAVIGVVVVGAVLWSNVLQYHDAWLAPYDQLAELEEIGQRFAGDGPALINEYQPYAVRHFLRELDAESPSELRYRPVALRDGRQLEKAEYANLDEYGDAELRFYRTLVLRRSPSESRPPSDYRRLWAGEWYEVWQRPPVAPSQIVSHVPLGDGLQAGGALDCSRIRQLAEQAGEKGQLAAPVREPNVLVDLSTLPLPTDWSAAPGGGVYPSGDGVLEVPLRVEQGGRFELWVAGSFRDRLEATIDGARVGSASNRIDHDGMLTKLGEADLAAGNHTVVLNYSGPDWRPGTGGAQFGFGPLVLSGVNDDRPVTYVEAPAARSLCGKPLDWVEALAAR